MGYFSKPSKPKVAANAQVYDFTKIELPADSTDKDFFKDSPSSTLETFYESPGEWVAKRRASRRLSLEVTKEGHQELSRSSSAPFPGPFSRSQAEVDELDFGKLDMNESTEDYQTVRIEDSQWKGVMPSEASVYDFTKVSSTDYDELEEYGYYDENDYGSNEWVKANPAIRSGRRSMDVFVKSDQDKGGPRDPWASMGNEEHDNTSYDNNPSFNNADVKAPMNSQQDDENNTEWVSMTPGVRSGRRSMDVLVKSNRAKHASCNTWTAPTNDEEFQNELFSNGAQYSASNGVHIKKSMESSTSRFPDYNVSPIHRQKSIPTSFPDYQ